MRTLPASLVGLSLALLSPGLPAAEKPKSPPAPTAADAHAFVEAMNAEYKAQYLVANAAEWVAETYITGDTEMLTARANETMLKWLSGKIDESRRFDHVAGIDPKDRRALDLLKLQTAMPAPKDPAHLTEATNLASKLTAAYGSGKYCKDEKDPASCRNLDQLSEVLATDRDWDHALDAWSGWHRVGRGMLKDYQRFAELLNEGARDLGYDNVGTMWRAGYDMPPAAFAQETDRLWGQVQPLYGQLQCYARNRLAEKYGDRMPKDGTIPAHITGNMWAQDWSNLYPLLQPYPGVGDLDVNEHLEAQRKAQLEALRKAFKGKPTPLDLAALEHDADMKSAVSMVRRSEDFYTSIGFPSLRASFYEKSMLLRPRDRDALCHASAWPMDLGSSDMRIKMCIKPTEEDQYTIYHEMGHIYYYVAYKDLPPIFQGGANDGFHEAIGDTIRLNITPAYLAQIGLAGKAGSDDKAVLNAQMKLALEKVAFLPFGLLIDKWRWGVFDGSIAADKYNEGWWQLRRKYQGLSSPVAAAPGDFDPGAKNHVPTNVPYMRYFLADILQFQFYRSLCDASGYKGPLSQCSIYGNKEAGAKYWKMLSQGAQQPWQQTLKELTGKEEMDASAIIDYFAPLYAWLQEQNKGKSCGWQ
ncbi:M2 family metallopeptidase [Dokdonella fugitiva]|uniref:M2 family metallopeptidase n=1 Tax=Dokdonella fugitiva TaxID=328517 RepID=UPI0015F87E8C|nr:M2 family metallopeptidase [Dokdonella fugitiva]MBA8885481.1 peptidyl-dipeptidase A [Dokdonella fugitiva]